MIGCAKAKIRKSRFTIKMWGLHLNQTLRSFFDEPFAEIDWQKENAESDAAEDLNSPEVS